MSDKILVIILKGETRPGDSHIKRLKQHFSDSCFILQVLNFKTCDDDTVKYKIALKLAHTKHNCPCLIIKDSSLIYQDVKSILHNVLHFNADLFFLCQYQGQCHQYLNVEETPHLKWTNSACATQAILFKPRAIALLLEDLKDIKESLLKVQKELNAIVCTPNIVILTLI